MEELRMSELKLAISNIAWDKADDEAVYAAMQQNGFTGLEIAPTRIFPEYPYENLTGAALFGGYLLNRWGVPCTQHAKHLVRPDRQYF